MNPHGGNRTQTPTMIVIHCMGEYIKMDKDRIIHAPDFLKEMGLSAHRLVAPDGTEFIEREDTQMAYHAKRHNLDSLGMEILVPGEHDLASLKKATLFEWVTDAAYNKAVEICHHWMKDYNITKIVRHSDLDPKRRWFDPGEGFPWQEFINDVRAYGE